MSDAITVSPIVRAVGLALLQFLWQGAAIGAMTALLLSALRKATASTRYLVACAGLAAMFVVPVLTTVSYMRAEAPSNNIILAGSSTGTPPSQTASAVAVAAPETLAPPSTFSRTWIEARLPFVVSVWLGGVLVLALHLLRGWRTVGRIRQASSPLTDARWLHLLQQIAERLGVTARVRLLTSSALDVPSVIGWLRPAIVIPVSALAGLSPAHLEAILAHELAHVRRGDYIVNIVQRVVETLLFYHPAVWWVSRQIRLERENCCDDLVVSQCADRVAYADALTSLEELRAPATSLAMGARGGDLLERVRRLIEPGHTADSKWSGGVVMSVVLTVLLLTVGAHLNGTTPDAAPPPQQTTEPKPVVVIVPNVLPTVTVDRSVAPPVVTVRPSRLKVSPTQGVPALTMRATLSGVVKAPSGGVVPGATVSLTSSTMTGSRVVNTDSRGQFSLNDLAPGTYDVTVTLPGFKTWKAPVQLTANQNATLNVGLEVGKLVETVTIRGGAPMPTGPLPDISQLQTASDFYDAAKAYYQRALFADAERLTNQALALVRSEAAATASAAPRPPDNSRVLRVGGNVKEPKIITRVEPIYPQIALTAKVQGYVIIEAIIATDGTVRDAKVIKPAPLLDEAALGAVRQWRYSPPIVDGEPVEVVMSVTVIFSLPRDGGGR